MNHTPAPATTTRVSRVPLLIRSWLWTIAIVVGGTTAFVSIHNGWGVGAGLGLFTVVWSVSRLWSEATAQVDADTLTETSHT